jgi:hypothetical protein
MIRVVYFFALAMSILAISAWAAVPQQINYQGYLTDTGGNALDTTVAMTFKLYNDSLAGNLLWTETRPSVTVTDGLFNIRLGQVTTLGDAVFNNTQVWLGITVGSNSEMTPRSRIVSVGYSYRVGTVDGASGGTITGDVNIVGKGNIGSGNSNPGTYAFVAGQNNAASGNWSTVSGGSYNSADTTCATVGGGYANQVTSRYGTISGGRNNRVRGQYAVVGGGGGISALDSNSAMGDYSTVAGGIRNTAQNSYASVGGGRQNLANGNQATVSGGYGNGALNEGATVSGGAYNNARWQYSVVAGGGGSTASDSNSASGDYSAIGGGRGNTANFHYAAIGGGCNNDASDSGATVGGGQGNTAGALMATVGGGSSNSASGGNAIVSGGHDNTASSWESTVGGGGYNDATGSYATVGGGRFNHARGVSATVAGGGGGSPADSNSASGSYSMIPGGRRNEASGTCSFAAGLRAFATNTGSFVWGSHSSTYDSTCSFGSYTFTVRCANGARFYTAQTGTTTGVGLSAGGGSWSNLCDVHQKRLHGDVNTAEVLTKIAQLQLHRWSYKTQDESIQHIGPTAQDFYAAFHLGESDTTINTLDPDGIALAAIQELQKQNALLEKRVAQLENQLRQLTNRKGDDNEQTSLMNRDQ